MAKMPHICANKYWRPSKSKPERNQKWGLAFSGEILADRIRAMTNSDFLRQKASTLLHLARTCFDMDTARQLRLIAEELVEEADNVQPVVLPFMSGFGRGGHNNGGVGRS